jgi:hypothetical protein
MKRSSLARRRLAPRAGRGPHIGRIDQHGRIGLSGTLSAAAAAAGASRGAARPSPARFGCRTVGMNAAATTKDPVDEVCRSGPTLSLATARVVETFYDTCYARKTRRRLERALSLFCDTTIVNVLLCGHVRRGADSIEKLQRPPSRRRRGGCLGRCDASRGNQGSTAKQEASVSRRPSGGRNPRLARSRCRRTKQRQAKAFLAHLAGGRPSSVRSRPSRHLGYAIHLHSDTHIFSAISRRYRGTSLRSYFRSYRAALRRRSLTKRARISAAGAPPSQPIAPRPGSFNDLLCRPSAAFDEKTARF